MLIDNIQYVSYYLQGNPKNMTLCYMSQNKVLQLYMTLNMWIPWYMVLQWYVQKHDLG